MSQLRVEGFIVNRWLNRWMEGLTQMMRWVLEVGAALLYHKLIEENERRLPYA